MPGIHGWGMWTITSIQACHAIPFIKDLSTRCFTIKETSTDILCFQRTILADVRPFDTHGCIDWPQVGVIWCYSASSMWACQSSGYRKEDNFERHSELSCHVAAQLAVVESWLLLRFHVVVQIQTLFTRSRNIRTGHLSKDDGECCPKSGPSVHSDQHCFSGLIGSGKLASPIHQEAADRLLRACRLLPARPLWSDSILKTELLDQSRTIYHPDTVVDFADLSFWILQVRAVVAHCYLAPDASWLRTDRTVTITSVPEDSSIVIIPMAVVRRGQDQLQLAFDWLEELVNWKSDLSKCRSDDVTGFSGEPYPKSKFGCTATSRDVDCFCWSDWGFSCVCVYRRLEVDSLHEICRTWRSSLPVHQTDWDLVLEKLLSTKDIESLFTDEMRKEQQMLRKHVLVQMEYWSVTWAVQKQPRIWRKNWMKKVHGTASYTMQVSCV